MTEERKIQIPVVVDASGATAGFEQIKEGAKGMAQAVAQSGVAAGKALDGIGDSAQKSSEKLEASNRKFEASIKKAMELQTALAAGPRGSAGFIEARAAQAGADVGALKPMLDQLRAIEAAQKGATAAVNTGAASLNGLGMSAKQTAYALRGVPAQFTDIITSLQGGQAPLTVFLQQGGQLKDMFGGIGPAARAMGGYIAGMVNPLTVTAAAVGAFAYVMHAGSAELRAFQNAATMSGNAIGQSTSQFTAMRDSLAGIAGTKGKAAEVLTEIASNGKLAAENVKGISEAAVLMEKATGQAIRKTVDEFVKLAEAPLTASLELNKQYNYLTAAVYSQIKALEEQGKQSQAAEVAINALAETTKSRALTVVDNAGLMEKAWRGVWGVIKGAGDAALNVGRPLSVAERLAQTSVIDGDLRSRLAGGATTVGSRDALNEKLKANQDLQKSLQRQLEIEQGNASATAEANRVRERALQATVAFDKLKEDSLTKQQKLAKEIAKAERDGLDAGKSRVEIEKVLASLRDKYKESGAAEPGQNEVAAIRAKIKEQQDYLQRLRVQAASPSSMNESAKLTDGEKQVLKIQEELKTSITGVSRAQKEKALVEAEALATVDKLVVAQERQNKGIKEAAEAYDKLVEATGKQADSIRQQAMDTEAANAAFGKSKTAIEAMALAQMRANLAEADSSDAFAPKYVAALAEKIKAQERYVGALQQTEIKQLSLSNSEWARVTAEETKTLQLQFGLLGTTQLQREKIIGQRQVELELAKRITEIDKASIPEADKVKQRAEASAIAALASSNAVNKAVVDDWQRTADQINSSITEALMRGFESGKGFAENMRDTIVNMFKTMVLRPIINAVVNTGTQGVAGALGLGGQGGGGLMGMANNASSMNSLWSAGSQFMSGGAAGASAASLGYANAVGMVGGDAIGALAAANGGWAGVSTGAALTEAYGAAVAVEAGTAAAAAGAAGATAGATAGISSALAAIPGWGWAAMAAIAVFGLSGKGGGPKTESGGGYGIGGYMNSGGPAADYAKGIEASYAGLAKQLGLTSTLSAGAFTSQDKAGDSMTQVQVAAALNGTEIYNRGSRLGGVENVGRSDEELQAALAEEATRVLFGALKASDLPEQYKAYLNTVADSASAMQAAIEKVVGVKQFTDALNTLPFDNLKDLAFDASDSLLTLSGSLESMLGSLKSYYELYYSDAERLAQSQSTMADTLAKVGLVLPATKDGFRELVNGMDLTTESSRIAYMTLLKLAPEFAATADGLAALAKTAAADLFKSFFDAAKIDFAGLSDALAGVDYSTFTETVALVFENLAGRIKGVMDGIAAERTATANAVLQINPLAVMTKAAIERAIADTAVFAPGNQSLQASQAALSQADRREAQVRAQMADLGAAPAAAASYDSIRASLVSQYTSTTNNKAPGNIMYDPLGNYYATYTGTPGADSDAQSYYYDPEHAKGNFGKVTTVDQAGLNSEASARADAEAARYQAQMLEYAPRLAAAQAALAAATAAQTAAVSTARQAQLDYIASLQDFAIDAGKSVIKLGKLREETLKYYEAQKQLSDLMTNSAAGLRESVRVTRMGQLDSAQSLAQRQAEFQTNYSMALVTSGATQAGYADKLAAALPDLSVALMDTASTREEWALATAALLAQSEAIAGKLEANTPTDYVAESLAMLQAIDTTLTALEASATSAEKIISDAVAAGSEKTASGLRAVIAALTGQTVPAFAAGGYHGGGLRIVGENGPELEASGPSRIWNASQTAAMLGGGGVTQELRALREEVRGLRSEAQAIAGHTNKTARQLERAMPDGDALAIREAIA